MLWVLAAGSGVFSAGLDLNAMAKAEANASTASAKSPKPFPASEALMKIAPMDHQLGGDAAKNRIVAG